MYCVLLEYTTLYMYCVLLEYTHYICTVCYLSTHTIYVLCAIQMSYALAFVECLVDHFTIIHYSDHHDDQDIDGTRIM